MKIGIMQPYFFPYLGYFQLINAVDKYFIYCRLNFIKEAWMNHNRILNVGIGSPIQFTIPVMHKSSNKMINEVRIHNKFNRQRKLLSTLFLNYKKAPYFNDVYPLLENIINEQAEYLYDFNNYSIIEIVKYLNIQTPISTNEHYFKELEEHLTEKDKYYPDYDENKYPVKILRIFEICRKEGADIFYNAIGGRELYDKKLFRKYNIDLGFIKTKPLTYKQYQHNFLPNLSIIDVMMFNGPRQINKMLDDYTLS